MERKIFYSLLHSDKTKEEKSVLFKKLKSLPNNSFERETLELIKILEMIDASNKEINKTNVKTYLNFYKGFNPVKYFIETKLEEMDLELTIDLFVKEKTYEANKLKLEKLSKEYEKTADESLLTNLEFETTKEKEYFIEAGDFINRTIKKFSDIKEGVDKNKISLSPSFLRLDVVTHGFEKGELILVAARPSVGKTAMALAFMNHFSKKNKTTLVTYEMSAEEVGQRMIYAKSGVYADQVYHKERFTDEVFERILISGDKMRTQTFNVIDEAPTDFVTLKKLIVERHKKVGMDVLIIDYLGLIRAYEPRDKYDPYLTTSQISAQMKILAKELNIVIILLQQVSRKMVQGNRKDAKYVPLEVTDLRDSGTLEQDANKIFLMWNKEEETEEEIINSQNGYQKLIVYLAKNRGGRSGHKFQFSFNKNLQRITEDSWLTAPEGWDDDYGDVDE